MEGGAPAPKNNVPKPQAATKSTGRGSGGGNNASTGGRGRGPRKRGGKRRGGVGASSGTNTAGGNSVKPKGTNVSNKVKTTKQGPKKPSTPPPAQTKLTVRKIRDVRNHGTMKSVLDMVRKLLEKGNERGQSSGNNSCFAITVDDSSFNRLVEEEALAAAAAAKFAESVLDEKSGKETDEGNDGSDEAKSNDGSDDPEARDTVAVPTVETKLEVIPTVNRSISPDIPQISARVLYAVPPKQSRRRGDRSGCVYLVLTAPKIDALLQTIREDTAKSTVSTGEVSSSSTVGDKNENVSTDGSVGKEEQRKPTGKSPPTSAEISRATAKSRLLLQAVTDVLSDLAEEDSRSEQPQFSGCVVEPSMSGKTWRVSQARPDRREGTVESSADFKAWQQSIEQQKEDLKARPKPAPGGGLGSSDDQLENGQPIPAIVLHLRAKLETAMLKKARKKKDKTEILKAKKKKRKDTVRIEGADTSKPSRRDKSSIKRKTKRVAGVGGNSLAKKKPSPKTLASSVVPTLLTKPPPPSSAG